MEFVKLHRGLDRASFDCGEPGLNRFLKEEATQYTKRGLCVVHALAEEKSIIGYFSLSSSAVQVMDLPPAIAKKFPQNLNVPCWLIGKLAVDVKFQGQGFGEVLLFEAMRKILTMAQETGGYCVVIDAKNEAAKGFYLKYGFVPFVGDELRLYLPLASIPALL